jgi:lysozyme
MSHRDIVRAQLRIDEGIRTKPYRDTVGKLTIGCGRNLDDVGLSMAEINMLLENDIERAEKDAAELFPNFDTLSPVRRAVLVNMAFNLGRDRLGQFRKLRKAVEACDWEQAAVEMQNSLWASQVGVRAIRLAKQMKEGV